MDPLDHDQMEAEYLFQLQYYPGENALPQCDAFTAPFYGNSSPFSPGNFNALPVDYETSSSNWIMTQSFGTTQSPPGGYSGYTSPASGNTPRSETDDNASLASTRSPSRSTTASSDASTRHRRRLAPHPRSPPPNEYPNPDSPEGLSSQPLQGIEQSPAIRLRPFRGHPNPLPTPLGTLPASLRPSNPQAHPWTHHVLRSGNGSIELKWTPGMNQDNLIQDHERIPGRRHGPLTDEQRQRVAGVRERGACWYCIVHKETCDQNDQCNNCKKVFRKWTLPCTRGKLEDRWIYVQPETLAKHLTIEKYYEFVHLNSLILDYSEIPTQLAEVTLKFGEDPLRLPVKEVTNFGPALTESDTFRSFLWSNNFGEYQLEKEVGPPVLPALEQYFSDPHSINDVLPNQIISWLEKALGRDDIRTDIFPSYCFYTRDHALWHRDVFTQICTYYSDKIPEHSVLKDGLMFAMLNYLLLKVPVLTENSAQNMYQLLQNSEHRERLREKDCTLTAVNKYIKTMIQPKVQQYAKVTLKHLHRLLFAKGDSKSEKDLAFCLTFIIIMIIGKNQVRTLSRTKIKTEDGLSSGTAWSLIDDLEKEGADPIIGLCKHRLATSQKKKKKEVPSPSQDPADSYAQNFKLLENVARITKDEAETIRSIDPQLRRTELGLFGAINAQRLLVKFYTQVFGHPDGGSPP